MNWLKTNPFKKNGDYISVIFHSENIKIAHLRLSGNEQEVIHVITRDTRGIAEGEFPQLIRAALGDFNVKKLPTVCVIPTSITTTKNIEIPSVDPTEIKSIINLQAGRHTPYSREEIILDYVNIGIYQRNYSKILLVIVNRNIIKRQIDILEEAGLKIHKVFFAPECGARFYSKILNITSAEMPSGIIDLSGAMADFMIAFRGTVITCRSIPVGIVPILSEGQVARDRLVGEIKKSIESYQSEDIENLPSQYILTGDNATVKELLPILKKELGTEVKIVPYSDVLKVHPAAKKTMEDNIEESFLDVVAPLAVLSEAKVDLMPEEVKLQKSIEEHGQEIAKSAVLIVVLIVMICGLFFTKIYFQSSLLNDLKVGYKEKRKSAKALEMVAEKTRIVKDYLSSRLVSLETIHELYRLLPEEIYLNSIAMNEEGTITIQGISESMSRVFSLVTALEESTFFQGVKTTSTTAKKERGKDVAAFELTFKLESTQEGPGETSEDEDQKEEKDEKKKG